MEDKRSEEMKEDAEFQPFIKREIRSEIFDSKIFDSGTEIWMI